MEVKAGAKEDRPLREKSRSQNTSTPRTHSFRTRSCDAERKIFFAEQGRMRIGWHSTEGTRLRSATGNVPVKMPFRPRRVFLAAVFSLFVVSPYAAKGQIPIGIGDDVSFAVIEAQQFGIPLVFAYHHTYDPAEALDGYALLNAIDSADPGLSFEFLNFGDDESPNYFLNSVT
jgi:hypothetical protein